MRRFGISEDLQQKIVGLAEQVLTKHPQPPFLRLKEVFCLLPPDSGITYAYSATCCVACTLPDRQYAPSMV